MSQDNLKAGDLVFYLDYSTQKGDFGHSPAFLVMDVRIGKEGHQFAQLKPLGGDGHAGWDRSKHYIKAPST